MFKSERFQIGFQASAYPHAQPGLLRADNVDFTQPGVARLRDGDEPLSMAIENSSPPANVASEAHALWHRGDELCLVDGRGALYKRNECEETWQRAGNWTPARLRQRAVISNGQNFSQVDAQTLGDCTLIVGEFGGRIDFAVTSLDGQVLVPPTTLAALGQDVRCAKADDWVLIMWTNGFGGTPSTDVTFAKWEPSNVDTVTTLFVLPGVLHLMPALGYPPLYDLRRVPDANRVAVLIASMVNAVFSMEVEKTGAIINASLYPVGGADIRSVSIYPLPSTVYRIAWWDRGAQTVNSALVTPGTILEQASAGVILDDATLFADAFGVAVATDPSATEPTRAVVVTTSTYTGGGFPAVYKMDVWETFGAVMTRQRFEWHTTLQSMAWFRDGQVFAATAFDPNTNVSPLVIYNQIENHIVTVQDVESGEIVSRGMRGLQVPGFLQSQNPVTPDMDGEVVRIPTPRVQTMVLGISGGPELDYFVYLLDHDFTRRAQSVAQLGGVAHAAHAGYIRAYDGETAYEHDWHVLPDIQQVSSTALGALVAGGTYTFALTWEWRNRSGDLHRSAPVLEAISLVPGQNQIIVRVRSLGFTERDDVRLVAWRSLNNDASVLYRETAVANNKAVRFIAITIGRADTQAQQMEPLDQQPAGAVLAHDPTPATDFCAELQGRLWTRDPERGWLVRFSLPAYEGFATGWNSLQGFELPGQRDATAIAEQDGQIILFTAVGAFVVVGNGPEINGGGQLYSTPQSVPLDTGALSQEGVVQLPTGIAYGSPNRGVRVLARTRTGVDLGGLVERLFLNDGQRVVAAVFDPDTLEMILLDDAPDGGTRGTLRLHMGTERWARDTGRQGRDMSLSKSGELAIVRLDGTVIRRVPGRVIDPASAAMRMTVRLPWGRTTEATLQPVMSGLQALITGVYVGPHRIECRLYRDYHVLPEVDGFIDVAAPPDDYSYRQYWATSNTGLRSMGVEVEITANGSKGVELVAIDQEMTPDGQTAGPLPADRENWTPAP